MATTFHSIERAKERVGINSKAAEHMIRNALKRGKDKTMFSCEQKRQWLISKENACGYKALVYNDNCFIVSPDNVVVTLYPVPAWFNRTKRYNGKERIRNQAKFERYNRVVPETAWAM